MSYGTDANILLYASNQEDSHFDSASRLLSERANDPDLLCMTWPTIIAYHRIATHASIFENPLVAGNCLEQCPNLL